MTNAFKLRLSVTAATLLVAAIFVTDLLTTIDLAAWLFYALPLLIVSWLASRRVTYAFAALCTVLIFGDFLLAPSGARSLHELVEHLVGAAVLWLMVVLLGQRLEARDRLARHNAILETRVQQRTADLEAERGRLAAALADLAASEARYRTIGELIPYGLWASDPDGNVIYLSDSFLHMIGKSLAECQKDGWTDRLLPEDRDRTHAAWQTSRETGGPWDYTYHICAYDGGMRHVLSRGMPMRDPAGQVAAWAGINLDITEHVQAEQALAAAQEQLRQYARRLVEDIEKDRQTIARELHDEAGQTLTAILMGLGMLERECRQYASNLVEPIQELKRLTDEAAVGLHRLSRDLRPASLDKLGLVAAVRQHIQTFERQQGIEVSFYAVNFENGHGRLPGEIETTVYRVVQEALTNVARHARAQHAGVVLKRKMHRVVAMVEDDGEGFDLEEALHSGRLGLVGMRERAELMGGRLDIESAAGHGTTIFLELPIDPANGPAGEDDAAEE